jgi:hypothetical protein
MLTRFDWLRRAGSGAELLATLRLFAKQPNLLEDSLGAPHSALNGPCRRCWIYARPLAHNQYCSFCYAVQRRARFLGDASRRALVVWGYVNQLPRHMEPAAGFYKTNALGLYAHDQRHFLLMLYRRDLKSWLQELVLYHGLELKGLLQIFPTMAPLPHLEMGEALSRIAQREANYSADRLRVQFYAAPAQIRRFSSRNKQGQLTFEIAEFLRLLEAAAVFRTLLLPDQQEMLYQLLQLKDDGEAHFYWGRFLGQINQETRDMLNAWQIRRWPKPQIELLYELIDHVEFYRTD